MELFILGVIILDLMITFFILRKNKEQDESTTVQNLKKEIEQIKARGQRIQDTVDVCSFLMNNFIEQGQTDPDLADLCSEYLKSVASIDLYGLPEDICREHSQAALNEIGKRLSSKLCK